MGGAILIVEDELVTQRLIAASLERAGYQAIRAASVEQAEAAIREVLPDLMLLDWILPGTTGMSFLRHLRSERRTREIPVIMLTGRSDEIDKVAGLEAGADDYLTKPFSHRELLARIKAVVRRRAPLLGDEPVEFGDLKLDPAAHRITAASGKISLWATEFRLLHFLMTHPDRVYSRGQLLDEVWGDHVFVEDRTVDVHIRRLRQALQPSGHEKRIETVRGAGYCFRANPG
ncbi:MAG: phosphate regulon transcriptional regulatory protein PhoB [Gammaproteobacteria bacterium 13_2_20CM_66_19]|nr:MAG: phosphate regulon transcriptional regulatory protein PhoB [Gammaproteobacteria bacterium 13_2_20CM_66_19]TLY59594.1 MAG: phosphate regulon transcriptional regulatory protein PhoB [Gammaproteobacteria bacterium]TLY60050.1 MAG: phosphate regulon transcriptional regulatory protein PhoB [Gammaproteobacteria bacterium]TLY82225.1 MAG: phosphate regulon transcriptional regulatory protein PhoB [Gammaproteobacteria bacterium]TLY97768.1 MAG: phosphate regulon transcriptional regulatory protein Ph